MAKTRSPSLAAPLKVAKSATATFEAKIRDHAAVKADALLAHKAEWTAKVLAEFEQLIAQRAGEQS